MTTLTMDESGPAKAGNGLALASEVGKVLSFFRPAVPLADALAKRDGITEAVSIHCTRVGLSAAQTASCIDMALACWNNGSGKSPAVAVAQAKLTANRIAYEVGGQGPRAA